ncbi:serine kinase [candidate division WOR_3 bacterium SM1_77]|uniref:Serine kinase n=1 Tax=candidate division WOR_3 bacterium SM1_77 TaxID=1703778 RepID=A0A0S8K4D1_UNCW3|nr:MAG: serine kinase [candidate division WOR_3 bacterium SM1_77]
MTLNEMAEKLNLDVRSAKGSLEREVSGGYASDLLSDVLANSQEGNIWVTLQIHQNIVAIASIKDLAGIILVNKREPEQETVEKAEEENIVIMVSELPAFELIGRLYKLGISGMG